MREVAMADAGLNRCAWADNRSGGGTADLMVRYHDEEWGVPARDDRALFERLVLESMQAGLSWSTVLAKREHMRATFFDFDPAVLAETTVDDTGWLGDAGLIRHRGKLEAMIGNARRFIALDAPGEMLWSFVGDVPIRNRWADMAEVPSVTDASRAMARDLKKLGFRFVGPTTCYAFMQSVGMVNDHLVDCFRHDACG